MLKRSICALSYLALLALSGCVSTATSDRAELDMPAAWSETIPASARADIAWSSFADPILQDLIAEGLTNNPGLQSSRLSLEAALIGIESAEARRGIVTSASGPNLSASEGKSRDLSGFISLSGGASYEIDLWGRLATDVELSELGVATAEESIRTAQISLVGQIAQTYFNLRVDDAVLELQQAQLELTRRQRDVAQVRYDAGVRTRLSVTQFDVEIQNLLSSIETTIANRRQSEQTLAVLLGQNPQSFAIEKAPLVLFDIPRVSPQTPVGVLAARPDVRAAEYGLTRADLSVLQARRAFLPSAGIGLSGSLSSDLADLLANPVSSWSVFADISNTLLDNGGRDRALRTQRINAERSFLNYHSVVLSALQDIDSALVAQNSNIRRIEIQTLQLAQQEDIARQTEAQFEAGVLSADDLIREQRTALNLREQEIRNWRAGIDTTIRLLRGMGIDPSAES
ncbi:MAG: efflux transporter outer membrane subunit [Henriciella sp.]